MPNPSLPKRRSSRTRPSAFRSRRPATPKPKPGPRARNYKCGQVYHIYQRGNFGRAVFLTPDEMAAYLNQFFLLSRRYQVRVHNFCLMKTHIHFVLEQMRRQGISKLMRDLQGLHTRKQNSRLETFGNLWNHSYRSKHVNSPSYYHTLMWYVSNNPVKAGLCKRVQDYKWSGAQALIAKAPTTFNVNKTNVKITLYLARFNRECEPQSWRKSANIPLPSDLAPVIDTIEQIKDRNILLLEAQQAANAERIAKNNARKQAARADKRLRQQLSPGAYAQYQAEAKAKAKAAPQSPPKTNAAPSPPTPS